MLDYALHKMEKLSGKLRAMVEHREERMATFGVLLESGNKFPRFAFRKRYPGIAFRTIAPGANEKFLQGGTPTISVPDEPNGIGFPFGKC